MMLEPRLFCMARTYCRMASVVTVLASAGVAVGLALQGALSNLAGGIMLMVFKPFKLGDYVDAAGVSGTVKEVTLFYTVIITVDNSGRVVDARIQEETSSDDRCLRDFAIRAARQSRFSIKQDAPARQRGDIIYQFLAQ